MTDPITALIDTQQRIREADSATDLLRAERAQLIHTARAAGHSWPAIGAALGMSHVAAMKAAKRATP